MKSAPQPTLPLSPCLPAASVFNLPHDAVRILQPSQPKTVQHLSFQPLAASLPSFCDSHPLFSTAYSLFSQSTRGGVPPKISLLESTTSRLFFPDLFATQLSQSPGSPSVPPGNRICWPFVFTTLRIPFPATPLFSHPSKTSGGVGSHVSQTPQLRWG
jgi:hypothetical protein